MLEVSWLELRGFRCHEHLEFHPDPSVNVLIGPNGAGKTSVLEALGYASTLRSFRRSTDAALVRSDSDEMIIRTGFRTESGDGRIEISVPRQGRRRVMVNGKGVRSHAELAQLLPVVSFLPDDLVIVKGPPGERRDFVDDLAARLSIQAAASQREFARALRQRNALLRRDGRGADPNALAVWDERLAEAGASVTDHRLGVLGDLEPEVGAAYASVAGGGDVRIRYESAWRRAVAPQGAERLKTDLLDGLRRRRARDQDVRSTTVGPQRDEPIFEIAGRPTRDEASQGEQRSLAIALRIASYELLLRRTGRPPILLLDDVFSELDEMRAAAVIRILPGSQVFVTSARDDEVPLKGRRWHVAGGSIR